MEFSCAEVQTALPSVCTNREGKHVNTLLARGQTTLNNSEVQGTAVGVEHGNYRGIAKWQGNGF